MASVSIPQRRNVGIMAKLRHHHTISHLRIPNINRLNIIRPSTFITSTTDKPTGSGGALPLTTPTVTSVIMNVSRSSFHTSAVPHKRLIIGCDGTGQSSMRGPAAIPTNVTRICSAIKDTSSQIIYYQSGVGTATIGEMYTTVASGTGLGINDNILDAYQFLSNNYETGDEIFLFGFSRGAFSACVLANLVVRLGLFRKRHLWMMRKAWARYVRPDKGLAFDDFVENLWKIDRDRTQRVTVKILGLWDTVGSVGMPDYDWIKSRGLNSSYSFYDSKLRYGVENAFHALAIDELRAPFTPTLLYLPDQESNSLGFPEINLKQCWFPGVHTNIGGGYPDEHMADITLFWMMEQCRGLLDFDEVFISKLIQLNHFPEYYVRGKLRRGASKVYPGWGKGKIEDSYWTKLMPLLGKAYRKPGQDMRATNETMHLSVRRRWRSDKEWRPWAMSGLKPWPEIIPVRDVDALENVANTNKSSSSERALSKAARTWKWIKRSPIDGKVVMEIPEDDFDRTPTGWQQRLRNISAKRTIFQYGKLDFLSRDSHAYLRDDYEPPVPMNKPKEASPPPPLPTPESVQPQPMTMTAGVPPRKDKPMVVSRVTNFPFTFSSRWPKIP